jgi:hypothetical protein
MILRASITKENRATMKHSRNSRAFGSCRDLLVMAVLFGAGLIHCAVTARAQESGSFSAVRDSKIDLFSRRSDSTQLEYFPLHVGDIWEYRTRFGEKEWTKIYFDTLFANGYRYFVGGLGWRTAPSGYVRIDSLLRVVYGVGPSCESRYPGVRPWENIPDGISYYHLDEPEGKTWWVCSDELGVLSNGETIVQYGGTRSENWLNGLHDVKYFKVGLTQSDDTIYVFTCALARTLGIVYEEWELDNMVLVGARIDGQTYGTITLDCDGTPLEDDILDVDRCYPNPAASEAHIGFGVSQPAAVEMDVYDMRGVCVKSLERGMQSRGRHLTAFSVRDLASGSYYCRIRAVSGAKTAVKHVLLSIVK